MIFTSVFHKYERMIPFEKLFYHYEILNMITTDQLLPL